MGVADIPQLIDLLNPQADIAGYLVILRQFLKSIPDASVSLNDIINIKYSAMLVEWQNLLTKKLEPCPVSKEVRTTHRDVLWLRH